MHRSYLGFSDRRWSPNIAILMYNVALSAKRRVHGRIHERCEAPDEEKIFLLGVIASRLSTCCPMDFKYRGIDFAESRVIAK